MSSPAPPPLHTTALHAFHVARHAHMVPFAGWEMPLYYRGILDEHHAVRTGVGLFDVSHMGILSVIGENAARLLGRRTTANVDRIAPGQCRYTFLLDSAGTIVDDLLITRLDAEARVGRVFLVIVNAATADHVFDLLRQHRRPDTVVARHNADVAILAVQGPRSRETLEAEFAWHLGPMRFYTARLFGEGGSMPPEGLPGIVWPGDLERGILVSRTGYTGELGYELFVRTSEATRVAEAIERRGAALCGLGARDTLRLEKGYLLSGQDFHQDHTPIEAGQERFIDFDHEFIGREVVDRQHREGAPVRLAGLSVRAAGAIPRHGTPVVQDGRAVAVLTSGGLSPTLKHGIGLAYLPPPLDRSGSRLGLTLRGAEVPAEVVTLPFVPVRRPG